MAECFDIRLQVGYDAGGEDFIVKIIDNETGETVKSDWIPLRAFKES